MSNKEQLEQARVSLEKRNQRQAAALSGLLFVGVLALCFFLTAFTIQDPPPGEQFVAVGFADLGSTEEAGGDTESETPSEVVQEAEEEAVAASEPEPVVEEAAEEVVTQESSEMAVNVKPDPDPEPEPDPEPVRQDRTAPLVPQFRRSQRRRRRVAGDHPRHGQRRRGDRQNRGAWRGFRGCWRRPGRRRKHDWRP